MHNHRNHYLLTRSLYFGLYIGLVLQLQACYYTCSLGYSGKVIDNKTEEPIEGVEIRYYDGGTYIGSAFSIQSGEFMVTGGSHNTFMGSKCEELKLEFIKPNYTTVIETTTTGEVNAVIRMTN